MSESINETQDTATETETVNETTPVVNVPEGTIETTRVADARETIKMVKYTAIKISGMNPRDAKKYTAEGPAADKARSLHKHGLKESLVLSERANGDLILLRGHLRYYGMGLIRTAGLPAIGKGDVWPAIPQDPHFMDTVRCRVFKGLSEVEEMDILMDHKDSVDLDRAEILTAVQSMVRLGYTERLIKEKLSADSRPSFYVRLAKLPSCVAEAWRKYEEDPKSEGAIKITDNAVNKLYSAYTADKDANPAVIKIGGPKFKAQWEEIVATGSPARTKGLPPSDLVALAEGQDDPDLRDVLVSIATGDKMKTGQALERCRIRLQENAGPRTTVIEEGIARIV